MSDQRQQDNMGMHIAYIAPEIPGSSSTFVYNEIFALERLGYTVSPFTIHEGIAKPTEPRLASIKARAFKIYGRGFIDTGLANIKSFFSRPSLYLKSFLTCFQYALKYISTPKIFFGVWYRFFVSSSVSNRIKAIGLDHIHAHFMHFPADIAMFSSMLSGVPFSVTAHANDIFCNYWLLSEKGNKAKFISTISNFHISYLEGKGIDRNRLRLVRCGVDTESYNTREPSPQSDIPVFGFLGRMVEKKGVDILLAASAKHRDAGGVFRVELVGDGPLMESLKSLATELSLNDIVSFKGAMDNDQVFEWLQSLDVFILPCKEDSDGDMDGIPVALMEAMLIGVPVLTTRLSGIPELVEDEVTGLLAKTNDVNSLAEKIGEITTTDHLPTFCANARERVQKSFDLTKNAALLAESFQK